MNNSDFYKLKYLKYKNKYISLKNKNELELKGGLTSESGIFLFYIPETVLRANNIGFPLEETGKILSRLITKDGKITTLSFQNLYDMSVLVIPPAPDKVNISSTKEWYIPQPLKKSKLKWGEEKPIKYDRKTNKIEYDSTSRKRWLYYIAKEFLNTNSKEFLTRFNLADLDKQSMICLEYDVSHVIANKFISKTNIDSIQFFQYYLKKYYNEYKTIVLLETAKIKLDTDLAAVSEKYTNAINKSTATYKIVSDAQQKLKRSEGDLTQAQQKLKKSEEDLTQAQQKLDADKQPIDKQKANKAKTQIEAKKQIEEAKKQIEQAKIQKEQADNQYKIDTAYQDKQQEERSTLQGKLKDIIKLEEFLATNLEFVTTNENLFKTFL